MDFPFFSRWHPRICSPPTRKLRVTPIPVCPISATSPGVPMTASRCLSSVPVPVPLELPSPSPGPSVSRGRRNQVPQTGWLGASGIFGGHGFRRLEVLRRGGGGPWPLRRLSGRVRPRPSPRCWWFFVSWKRHPDLHMTFSPRACLPLRVAFFLRCLNRDDGSRMGSLTPSHTSPN